MFDGLGRVGRVNKVPRDGDGGGEIVHAVRTPAGDEQDITGLKNDFERLKGYSDINKGVDRLMESLIKAYL